MNNSAKLLVVHADDLGMTHSVNAASTKAIESGLVPSASVMVPCPWFPEIADWAKAHPEADLGVHLTVTSERPYFRWAPVASRNKVGSLVDVNGYFHGNWEQSMRIDPKEVERELCEQIDRALAMGIRPTHLDSHQNRLLTSGKRIFRSLRRAAREYKLPLVLIRNWFGAHPHLGEGAEPSDIIVDRSVTIDAGTPAENWAGFYTAALRNLQPGVTEFVIHLGFDDEEMRAATRDRDSWGAAWRQRDFDFFTSQEFKRLLDEYGVKLVTCRELPRAAG